MFLADYAPVLIFAAADRLMGIGKEDVKDGKSKGFTLAVLGAVALGWFHPGTPLVWEKFAFNANGSGILAYVLCTLAWIASRSMPFRGVWGKSTVRKDGQFYGLVFRFLLFIVPVTLFMRHVVYGDDLLRTGLILLANAVFAGLLGIFHGEMNADAKEHGGTIQKWVNAVVETLRGAGYGLAVSLL